MSFSGSERYGVGVDEALAALLDEATTVGRYESVGDTDIELVASGDDADDRTITTRRTVAVDLPGFAAKVLQPTNTMTQTDRWGPADYAGNRHGTFEVSVDGAPVSTSGSMSLTADDDGCVHRIEGKISVSIPIVGRRIAKWSEGTAKSSLLAEFAYNKSVLED